MAPDAKDRRPPELVEKLASTKDANDTAIAHALHILSDPKTRGNRKVSVTTVCELTGLSKNTVRGRTEALTRLRVIKNGIRDGRAPYVEVVKADVPAKGPEAVVAELEKRVTSLLEQNAVLFEENIRLQTLVDDLKEIQKKMGLRAV